MSNKRVHKVGEGDHTCFEITDGVRHLVSIREQKRASMSGGKKEWESAQGSTNLEKEIGKVAQGGEL